MRYSTEKQKKRLNEHCYGLTLNFAGSQVKTIAFLDSQGRCVRLKPAEANNLEKNLKLEKALQSFIDGKTLIPEYPFSDVLLSSYQKKLFAYLDNFPRFKTIAYKELADVLNTSARGVASALAHNPLPLFHSCHLVIKSDGSLGGYIFGEKAKAAILKK